ncbi:hypothetical protein KH389_06290 [Pseudomonas qingdaonensis]|uniref:Uncharacterized protein n=1 Tax=Pseudomonas qingdaonensis TaxID=2056231 RepID=A0ABX8E276_9PSED|nr:hypothetical protein KH389_06290 [Pseudomonas qingdaonensis]
MGASKNDTDKTPKTARAYAVAAALEVIALYASSGNPKFSMRDQMSKLSDYADMIQEALKLK